MFFRVAFRTEILYDMNKEAGGSGHCRPGKGIAPMETKFRYISDAVKIQCVTKLALNAHLHEEVEMVYVEEGYIRAYADGVPYDVQPGDVFVSFPNQIHFYERCAPGKYVSIVAATKVFFGIREVLETHVPGASCVPGGEGMDRILEKCQNVRDISSAVGCVNLLMSALLPKLACKKMERPGTGTIREILAFCDDHFREDINLSVVAQETHLSRCYISHLFRSKLNIGFSDYINMLRINEACRLLTETDKKITDISGDVGYGTIRSFNRVFQQIKETTPQGYRNTSRS